MNPVIISFVISLLIGLVAGGCPANRAARLRPIEGEGQEVLVPQAQVGSMPGGPPQN